MTMLKFKAKYHSLLLIFCLIFVSTGFANNSEIQKIGYPNCSQSTPLPFIENSGQYETDVLFYSNIFCGTSFVTKTGELVYSMSLESDKSNTVLALKEIFSLTTPDQIFGLDEIQSTVTNFHGKSWQQQNNQVSAYNAINLGEVASGINLHVVAHGNNIEKIFSVNPGSDPKSIKINLEGSDKLSISESGELLIESSSETISFTPPFAYQDLSDGRRSVEVDYWVCKNSYGFTLGEYDPSFPLTIDPMLASTFLGGSNVDDTYEPAVQCDSQGYVYITGFTYSTDFPTTTGVIDTDFTGYPARERFVTKFTPDLSTIVASTFLGGAGEDWGMGICFDAEDNLYLGGYTSSLGDFPLTDSSYVSENLGGLDAYIVKLSNDLTTLLGSTVFGGSLDDGYQWPRMNIEVGASGNIYAVGLTKSFNFPYTTGAFDTTYCGGFQCNGGDAFIAKFNSNLTELLGSTFVGGSGDEWRVDLVLDSQENVIITGDTYSPDLSTIPSSYHPNFDFTTGCYVVFVAKYSSDLSELMGATYLGGPTGDDDPLAVIVDHNDNICVSGYTNSQFPTTPGAYDRTYNGLSDVFIAILSNDLTTLLHSTFFGGSGMEQADDLTIDANGNIFVGGLTTTTNLPSHPDGDAYDPSYNGGDTDAFIAKFSGDLSSLLGVTYVGGSGSDNAKQIAVAPDGNVFLTGITVSTNFPTTPGSHSPSYNGGNSDIFVFKISPNLQNAVSDVDENSQEIPNRSFLMENYPNPFNAQTKIQFVLENASPTSVKIYDISGRLVSTLMQSSGNVGQNSVVWNGTNSAGENVSSGTYFFEVESDSFKETGKMILLK